MTRASTNSTVLAVCSKSPVKCLSNDSALTRSLHTALMVYDWLISLDQEIATIWSKPRTGASVLYLFNRYSLLVSYVLNISTIGRMSTQAHLLSVDPNLKLCRGAMDQHWFGILVSAQSCRVYALTGQNKALSGLTLALGMMPFIVNVASRQLLYGLIHQAYTSTGNCIPDPHRKYGLAWLFQCVQPTRNHCIPKWVWCHRDLRFIDRGFPVILLSRIPMIICETVVVIITWTKASWSHGFVKGDVLRPTLHLVMLENDQGSIYFIILLSLNAMQIILNVPSLVALLPQESYFSEFIDPITSVLTSHFILNLRHVHEQQSSYSIPSCVFLENHTTEEETFLNSLTGPVHSFGDWTTFRKIRHEIRIPTVGQVSSKRARRPWFRTGPRPPVLTVAGASNAPIRKVYWPPSLMSSAAQRPNDDVARRYVLSPTTSDRCSSLSLCFF
ncbi:hypothetical protein NUW54_g12036 [Trametes sanguinea]|uniref:Uncharacterized protein n=1 Tax=Trametes sanguinea TaxID=158606 RepID=A0ACC1N2U0_9APHY|nr:hypothetical protein NUW54_g12036 [Trametes sanguinea]